MSRYVNIYIYILGSSARSARPLGPCGPPWALVGRALVTPLERVLFRGVLFEEFGFGERDGKLGGIKASRSFGNGGGTDWTSWALVCQAIVGPAGPLWAPLGVCGLGPCGPLGPCGAPWAFVSQVLVGSPGPMCGPGPGEHTRAWPTKAQGGPKGPRGPQGPGPQTSRGAHEGPGGPTRAQRTRAQGPIGAQGNLMGSYEESRLTAHWGMGGAPTEPCTRS